MTASTRVDEFEELRPHLLAVAYRLTGTVADAEDIVQDAWLRWDGSGSDAINDLRAWLTTVVSRLGLDRLRSAAHRRETYVGEWLPEPVVTELDGSDPLSAVVAGEDARFAAMVVLERLTPDQRVAFVLHDGFEVPFAEIADVLGGQRSSRRDSWRPAHDGRWHPRPPSVTDDSHNEVVGTLMAAMVAGDMDAVVHLLHPDVTFTGDSNRKAPHRRPRHSRPGQGGAVPVRAGQPLRAGVVGVEPAGDGQRRSWAATPAARPGSDGYPAMTPRIDGDDGARRKGLRHLGYREPGQVHRFAAAS